MLRSVALGMALAVLAPPVADAATLGFTSRSPSLTVGEATLDFLRFGAEGDLSTFGDAVDAAEGISPAGVAELSFGVGFPLADPTDATGGFDVVDADGLFLDGTLSQVGFEEGVIELLFADLGGPAADAFGPAALATVVFTGPLGPDPFAALADDATYEARITLASAVPLPASALLLLASTGLLGAVARSRRVGA